MIFVFIVYIFNDTKRYFGGDVVHGVVELTVVKERGIKSKGVHLLFAAFEQSMFISFSLPLSHLLTLT